MENSTFFDPKEGIRFVNTKSALRQAYYPIVIKPEYTRNKIPLGIDELNRKIIHLPVNEAFRILLLSRTRSGKTFFSQSMISRMFHSDFGVIILNDIKNEYSVMKYPVQDKFANNLHENESPKGLPIKVYRPQFLIVNEGSNVYKNIPIQIPLSRCSYHDLTTLLGIESQKDDVKREILDLVYQKVLNGEINDLDEFADAIMEIDPIQATVSQKRSIIRKIHPLKTFQVVGNQFPFDVVEDILDNQIPIINMTGFDEMGREYSSFPQAYIAYIIRSINKAKRMGTLPEKKRIVIFIDEIKRFCAKDSNTTSRREILEAYDVVGGKGINFIACAQNLTNLPDDIYTQSRFIAFPRVEKELRDTILKQSGLWEYGSPSFMTEVNMFFNALKKFTWVLLDKDRRRKYGELLENLQVLKPFSPLCRHKESEGKHF